jgi:hypothetical protein
MRRILRLPQGSSLRFGLCYPDPSTLNRPHPPHSRAHRDFTARRLIRDAFAVRERLGNPRVVPSFRCLFLPDMPSSTTPGSSTIHKFQSRDVDIGLRHHVSGSALPKSPQSASRGGTLTRLPRFTHLLRPVSLLAPLYGPDRISPANGDFYIQAFNEIGPLLDMTTASTGLLRRRDFHPLE